MKTKGKIPERDLLKALTELEETIEKGDALKAADPEGDLSTEGEALSDKAEAGRSDAKKGRRKEDLSKMMSASDMASDDGSGDDESEEGDKEDDESDDDASPMGKSFREQADDNETMSKAIEVSEFIEAMVDEVGAHLDATRKSLVKSFGKQMADIVSTMQAHFDARLAAVQAAQAGFNAKMAKALTAIGTSVNEQEDMLKSLGDRPALAPRGKAVLTKSEIALPPGMVPGAGGSMADGSGGGDDDLALLADVPSNRIFDWMFAKAQNNQLDPMLITAFEATKDPSALPFQVRKALVNDLCK